MSDCENQEELLKELSEKVPQLPSEKVEQLQKLIQVIEYVGIDDIHLSANKARRIKNGVPKVAASIRECGFRNPIYVDATNGEIICGHTRWAAAKLLGLTRVPVVKVSDLTPELVKLLRLADNKVAEFSAWDFSELNAELDELRVDFPELDFTDFGFGSQPEIEWDDGVDDIDDDNYEEPDENNIQCPHCGYVAGKSFFRKPTAGSSTALKKEDDGEIIIPSGDEA